MLPSNYSRQLAHNSFFYRLDSGEHQLAKQVKMIPDKAPREDVYHAGGDLKKEAHIPSFEKYKEMYMKSIENPDGKQPLFS